MSMFNWFSAKQEEPKKEVPLTFLSYTPDRNYAGYRRGAVSFGVIMAAIEEVEAQGFEFMSFAGEREVLFRVKSPNG